MRDRIGHLEITVCARSARVNDALWNSLVIEMGDLLPEGEIFQKRRTAPPGFQCILVVRNNDTLIGREGCLSGVSGLMRGAPRTGDEVLLRVAELLKSPSSCLFLPLKRSVK